MSKHTPGPWRFIDATQVAGMQFAPKCVIKAGDKQIASFSWGNGSPWFPTKDESQANARLIAAAPDLLGMVRILSADGWVDRSLLDQADQIERAKALIAGAMKLRPISGRPGHYDVTAYDTDHEYHRDHAACRGAWSAEWDAESKPKGEGNAHG